jgi:multidrug efflux pump subunit AcrA (membrane-fusion protein)
MRPVEVSRVVDAVAVVSSGLEPGERVVTDGQLKLTPGAAVREAEPAGQKDAS